MKQEFYSLPLKLDELILKKEHARCSLHKSVAQQLHLILTTSFGELPGDEAFGCSIWDHDFDNVSSSHRLIELIRESVLKSVHEHEKRLCNVRVELVVHQEELLETKASRRVKKRMDISIKGMLLMTNENFNYTDSFFVGPLSY